MALNDLRPMTVDVKTGFVTLGHGGKIGGSLSVGNELHVAGNGNFNGTGFITKNGLNSYSNESGNHHQTNGLRLQGAGNLFAEIYHHEQIGEYHELAIHVANGGGDGWFGFRPDGGFYLNGPGPSLNVGAAKMASDGNILGSCWGNKWLWDAVIEQVSGRVDWGTFNREVGAVPTTDYVNVIFVKRIRLGARRAHRCQWGERIPWPQSPRRFLQQRLGFYDRGNVLASYPVFDW